MLTIGQLAAYAGVTVRAVRHYHQIGLLPEPERDASGYRRYGATAVVSLIKIRTLANAGVPLSQIGQMLEADASTFADGGREDRQPPERGDRTAGDQPQADRAARRRGQSGAPAGGDLLPRPASGARSVRTVGGGGAGRVDPDRGALARARPRVDARARLAQLEDPRIVRLYRVLSELFESDTGRRLASGGGRRHHGRPGRAGLCRRRDRPR